MKINFKKNDRLYFLVSCFLALYYTFPFLIKYNYWGIRDWDLFTTVAAIPVGTVLHYGQFPFWNPYMAGGNVFFQHPEAAVLSPFVILYFLFGAVVGLKIQVLIAYFLGFCGSYKLFKQIGISSFAAMAGAVAYFGSVHFALHFTEGHIPFTHFCFLPWFIYFLLKSKEKPKNIIFASLTLALMVLGNGAAIPLLYTLTFSFLLFAIFSIEKKQLTFLKNFFISVFVGLAIAAIKFLPMVIYLFQIKWKGNPYEVIPLSALWKIFFGFNQTLFAKNYAQQYWGWHEYGAYISPLLVILALVALIKYFRKNVKWLLLLVIFLTIGLGDFSPYSPWALLSHLPGFSSARCTGRSFQFVILSFAILGGLGFDILKKTSLVMRYKLLKGFLYLIILVIVATNMVLAYPILSTAFTHKPSQVFRSPNFVQAVGTKNEVYRHFLENRGSLLPPWLSAYHRSRGLVDDSNNVDMEIILSGRAEIVHRFYTPNRIEYEINAIEPGDMVISMGYDEGWHATDGRTLFPKNDLIAFPFKKGNSKVILYYRTPYFYTGMLISIIAIIGCFLYGKKYGGISEH